MKQPFIFQVSETIWDLKYRYRLNGKVIDHAIEDTWTRVAKSCARIEQPKARSHWQRAFFDILEGFQYLPGGRILAGSGTRHKVTLFNCFVMDIAEDSLVGIFNALKEGAMTLQQGGGVGYDFSILRPRGDLIKKTGFSSTGPVSFMRIWDSTSSVLISTGARRGAMMGVLRVDHPDIFEFIEAKREPGNLTHFNVSVLVTDAFMQAVERGEPWPLVFPVEAHREDEEIVYRTWGNALQPVACKVYKYVDASALWEKIIRAAYDYAEPGVIFVDKVNRWNTLYYREQIHATNPCGEIPLPAYGACNLGAVNLTQFVLRPFADNAAIDWIKLEEVVRIATRMQDNVIDVAKFPLLRQKKEAFGARRIGLGLTGLADTFVMLNMVYGSQESLQLAEKIMRKIQESTWMTSIELAQEKGAFPYYHEKYLKGNFVATLPRYIQKNLSAHGIRNSHHNTIAPTGTTSLIANNVSNGIEPIFDKRYTRKVKLADGSEQRFEVECYAVKHWHKHGHQGLPPAYTEVSKLTPKDHLAVQAVLQPFIDNAISKTINIPKDFPLDAVMEVYSQAYQLNLKGCTIFRPNPITGSVLTAQTDEDDAVDRCCQVD